jgi:hypothetical protein
MDLLGIGAAVGVWKRVLRFSRCPLKVLRTLFRMEELPSQN